MTGLCQVLRVILIKRREETIKMPPLFENYFLGGQR